MKHVTIYIPEGNELAYVDNADLARECVTSTQLFGALKAAMLQAELCLRIKLEQKIIQEYEERQVAND
jgi:hypothetical protein